jgi:oligosaccharide 4-alpha-D-glucosyltransferase
MKKGFLFIAAVLSFSYVFGQALHRHDHTTDKGRFIVVQYDSNIYKIVYHPRGYVKNENISDAVIIQPGYQKKQHEVRFRNDSVFINKKLVLAGVHENGNTKGFLFPLDINEKIFGGGERALSLNRRGTRLNLYNNPWYGYGEGADNLNYSVPFITSSAGYGIFFDNPSRSYIDIGKSSQTVMEYGAGSGELNFFLILGNYRQVLESYHRLTGKQPLPPRWAFGNLMSRFGYTSEENVKSNFRPVLVWRQH